MKDFFNPEDFEFNPELNERYQAALIANQKLNALIESMPMVYGQVPPGEDDLHWYSIEQSKDTHRARLAFVEEIKKECVKHEPMEYQRDLFTKNSICKHCGVELQATWSEKK